MAMKSLRPLLGAQCRGLSASSRLPPAEATAGRGFGLYTLGKQGRSLHQPARKRPPTALRPLISPRHSSRPSLYTATPYRGINRNLNDAMPYSTTSSPPPAVEPTIHSVFEPQTSTWQYLVADPSTHAAVIIDPVLDYDNTTRTITTAAADALLAQVRAHGYTVSHILETHAHADHLTAAFYLRRRLATAQEGQPPPSVGIGRRIGRVQRLFAKRYGIAAAEYEGVFDRLWGDDEVFPVGGLSVTVMHLPGHTPDHVGYRIGDNVFCGDSIFHPALGTARCDFPGGSAHEMYQSGQKLLALPGHVKIWAGHDYPEPGERDPEPWATVAEHKARNKYLREGISEDQFVEMRTERDSQLGAPRLLHESLQLNVRAGRLPRVDESGMRTFKLPIKVHGAW